MHYRYENVCLEALAYTLPEEIVTTEQIEARLAPLYRRLRLPEGRLELMTGIQERRFWPPGTLPSEKSIQTAEKAICLAGLDKRLIGALVHGSVCRDCLEPATACAVHEGLGLPGDCAVYDVSNACLGMLNGMLQVANMIELGQIRAGIVVGTESSRTLVEATIERLNRDTALSRRDIKPELASLTVGSASAAVVLVERSLSRAGNRLLGGVVRANTSQCHLCRSGRDESLGGDAGLRMATDSEELLQQGVATAKEAFAEFLAAMGWQTGAVAKTFCHQVGRAHRKLLLETLALDAASDYTTFPWLGNTGAAALPLTAAIGTENGHLRPGDRAAWLGIGSGINVIMLGLDWRGPGGSTAR